MAISQGTRLGRYEIRSLLGAGAMGEVYLADDVSLRRQVAVKVLRAGITTNMDGLQRFEREAHAASSLNHPNILTIFEIGHEDNCHFIVTEFIDGDSLGRQVNKERFELQEVIEIGIQVASALAAAHEAGIVHRDIKLDNIMLRRDRRVKILDFGLAKLGERPSGVDTRETPESLYETRPGAVMGTPLFMSPEQARGLAVDARTDIWSLGVVLYRLVTHVLPFPGQTSSDVLVAVLTTDPPELTRYVPDVPPELERIVMKTLRKDQAERYRAMKDLELDLKTLKQRLEFEAELKRTGRLSEITGESGGPAASGDATLGQTVQLEQAPTAVTGRQVRKTAGAAYVVGAIRGNKRAALLSLAMLIVVTTAAGYFVYSRFLPGSEKGSITSLAVLPLKNMSNDPEKDYLSDGISESLINRLSQLPGLKVIANSSSVVYKDLEPDPLEVARALDITGMLTGRISQRGDSVAISVELIDARDRTQVWGEQYIRKPADLLAVQAEISKEIAEKLRLRLTAGQQQHIARPETQNIEAYELLLKGRFHRARGGVEDRKKAADYFNQAIALDARYAPAYAELSDIYRSLVGSSVLDSKEYLPKGEAAAKKALELDESLADAHYALANLKTYAWEWADAERGYKRAIELNANLALAHRWYASYLRLMGQHEQAISEIKRARELDPLSPGVNATVGYILFNAREHDQAIEVLKNTLGLDGDYPYTYLFLGFNYAAKGMYTEAIGVYQQAIALGLDTPSTQIFLGSAYAGAGQREKAQSILKRLQMSKEYISPGQLAILHAALGEREQAFTSLEKAYQERDLQLQYLGVDPAFDPLRSDARFRDVLRRVGLAP